MGWWGQLVGPACVCVVLLPNRWPGGLAGTKDSTGSHPTLEKLCWSLLLTTCCLLLATYYLLLAAHYLLLTTYYLLLTVSNHELQLPAMRTLGKVPHPLEQDGRRDVICVERVGEARTNPLEHVQRVYLQVVSSK